MNWLRLTRNDRGGRSCSTPMFAKPSGLRFCGNDKLFTLFSSSFTLFSSSNEVFSLTPSIETPTKPIPGPYTYARQQEESAYHRADVERQTNEQPNVKVVTGAESFVDGNGYAADNEATDKKP